MSVVLVTGAAGFIGSHLTEHLLDEGHDVVGMDNFDHFYDRGAKERNLRRARTHPRFTEVEGDIRDPRAFARVPRTVDTVVHLAARAGVRPSIEDPQLYQDVNLRGTQVLLDFMREHGVRRLLFGSSSSVYGDDAPVPFSEEHPGDRPVSPYAATKRAGELMVHAYTHLFGMDALCLRFFTVYGPRQRPDLAIHKFARLMSRDEHIPMFGDGTSQRDYTFIDDIVAGITGAMDCLGDGSGLYDVVNLGSNRTISLQRMIDQLAEAMEVEPRVNRLDEQPGDVRRTYADVSKAESLFGYRPTTSFEDGIREFVAWFREEQPRPPAARRPQPRIPSRRPTPAAASRP